MKMIRLVWRRRDLWLSTRFNFHKSDFINQTRLMSMQSNPEAFKLHEINYHFIASRTPQRKRHNMRRLPLKVSLPCDRQDKKSIRKLISLHLRDRLCHREYLWLRELTQSLHSSFGISASVSECLLNPWQLRIPCAHTEAGISDEEPD